MIYIFGKMAKILVATFSFLVQVANMFLANIIVYEATEGIKFNVNMLFTNKLFWITIAFNLVYYAIPLIIKQKSDSVDEALEEAISQGSVSLVHSITQSAQNGDFESSKKMMKILDQIQKRRRK